MDAAFSAYATFVGQDTPESGFDRDQWQDAVNAAEFLRLLEKARTFGLVDSAGRTNKPRCAFLLRRGRQLGIEPDMLRCRRQADRLSLGLSSLVDESVSG